MTFIQSLLTLKINHHYLKRLPIKFYENIDALLVGADSWLLQFCDRVLLKLIVVYNDFFACYIETRKQCWFC